MPADERDHDLRGPGEGADEAVGRGYEAAPDLAPGRSGAPIFKVQDRHIRSTRSS
jgi:hypothetical protein